ncbi:hypothetical protein QL285_034198 [Trifolium repens]|nr:hypothetical protein QL285_034198 [Trifolium repens]
MNSGRIFEVECFTQDFSENRVWPELQSKGFGLKSKSVEHFEVGGLKLSCAGNSGALAVASKSSPGESLRVGMLYKCENLMLGCWRHY